MTKTCKRCLIEKPAEEFYTHKAMGDGRLSFCKDCVRNRITRHRRANESVREYDRSRGARQGPEYRARYVRMNRTKCAARALVAKAVESGRLIPEPCLFCGRDDRVVGHHQDYSRPLDVTWLCYQCHSRLHALLRKFSVKPDEPEDWRVA